ncbi:MAG: glycosyltransferase family 2 protein [Myxococcota bacterium]
MSERDKTIVVVVAYNAAHTLKWVIDDIPKDVVDEILVVDDASADNTAQVAQQLPVELLVADRNRGYGGNQKSAYREALDRGAEYVVMIHGDYQYDARMVGAAVDIIRTGNCDVVLGNRIRTRAEALAGGMPRIKYFANRGLTIIENVLSGQNLGEWHSGFRAYSRDVLETIPFERNSDDFVFDSQFLIQCVHFGFKMGDIPVPVRYFDEASSINLLASSKYALDTLRHFGLWFLHKWRIVKIPLFMPGD